MVVVVVVVSEAERRATMKILEAEFNGERETRSVRQKGFGQGAQSLFEIELVVLCSATADLAVPRKGSGIRFARDCYYCWRDEQR